MARITIEDCLQKVPNRFELVLLAAKRAKQLFQGAKPLLANKNREIVTALREIAAGMVRPVRRNREASESPLTAINPNLNFRHLAAHAGYRRGAAMSRFLSERR